MSRRTAVVVVAAVAVLGASGGVIAVQVLDDGDVRAAPPTTTTAAVTTTTTTAATSLPTTTTTEPRGRRGSGEAVTIAFGGDVHFEGVLEAQLANDPQGVLDPIEPVLAAAELAVVNLETTITERGTPEDKAFTFRAPRVALDALIAAGVDVASMANNHGLDFGPDGFLDSLVAESTSGLPIIGIGRNAAEAYAPYRAVVRGQRIAVIGATQVLDARLIESWTATDMHPGLASAKEVDRLLAAVREARETSDTVVVFLHWGIEKQTCPWRGQRDLAQALADAGADIIVGGHAHRLQGAGRLGQAFVAYGLGNFVFYARPGPGARSGVLLVTVTGRDIGGYEWKPAEIRSGVPYPLEGDEATAAVDDWNRLRDCTGLTP